MILFNLLGKKAKTIISVNFSDRNKKEWSVATTTIGLHVPFGIIQMQLVDPMNTCQFRFKIIKPTTNHMLVT